jgi:hypothetical protein
LRDGVITARRAVKANPQRAGTWAVAKDRGLATTYEKTVLA